jgi:hypothetical protein
LDERRSSLFNGKEGDEIFLSSFQEDVKKGTRNCFFLDEGKRGVGGRENVSSSSWDEEYLTYSFLSGMFSSMSRH